jgi:RND family efflux transporter MFP subunit
MTPSPDTSPQISMPRKIIRAFLVYIMPLVVLAGGVVGAVHMYKSGPEARRKQPEKSRALVQVQEINRTDTSANIKVMGTVVAARRIVLQPRVSGEVVKISPKWEPGGRLKAGEFVLQIDQQDYQLAVEQARSAVAQARYELKLEQGHQDIAKREWELLDVEKEASELDRELALRKPHLKHSKAKLEAAKASLKQAELDLERTTVKAPFNCLVTEENIDLGAQVSPQTQLGSIVGTDEYWVRASVPVDHLQWIQFPETEDQAGSRAVIQQQLGTGSESKRSGHIVRLMGDLEQQGRMARVLISVPDPLQTGSTDVDRVPLLIGSYVNVNIKGKKLENVIPLPRTALHEGDKVWIMNQNERLEIRHVDYVWRNRETVFVRNDLHAGELLVTSDLAAPIEGMALALSSDRQVEQSQESLACRKNESSDVHEK